MGWWRRKGRHRRIALGLLVIACLALTPVATAAIYLRLEDSGTLRDDARTRGRDALWLGHAWVDGRKSDTDIAELGIRLAGTGIKDLYVHTGPLDNDGTLRAELYPRARWFIDAVHRTLPGIRVQAWLGDLLTPEFDGLNTGDPGTRDRVVMTSSQVLDLGFDGIHFDFEPVRSGSSGYIALLEQVRAVTSARHSLLSVSAPVIDPLPGLHSVGVALFDHGKWWSQDYFAQVARRVDQIAVMSYDTAMPTRSLYGGYVAQQTTLALQATPATVDLLMGLPAFRTDDLGHHAAAETVAAGIRGVRVGLARTDRGRRSFGVALYVDFAATEQDWADYRRGWS
ncbi:hypothetical protein [Nocardia sp. CDC160]|uniref:hypothetical protein n=1 Tax=Nocardia sp. CDC160 TaxID=3112166 RepID=UPI002DB5BD86|nr:hypothetical protein [Nocardia sp. CDC160]MEC3914000.1 hypothetical protein [Nocardia sp. CDC160]